MKEKAAKKPKMGSRKFVIKYEIVSKINSLQMWTVKFVQWAKDMCKNGVGLG